MPLSELGISVECVKSNFGIREFLPIERRSVVERTFSLLPNYRRLMRNYEQYLHTAKGIAMFAMVFYSSCSGISPKAHGQIPYPSFRLFGRNRALCTNDNIIAHIDQLRIKVTFRLALAGDFCRDLIGRIARYAPYSTRRNPSTIAAPDAAIFMKRGLKISIGSRSLGDQRLSC